VFTRVHHWGLLLGQMCPAYALRSNIISVIKSVITFKHIFYKLQFIGGFLKVSTVLLISSFKYAFWMIYIDVCVKGLYF
jgi:hypothetical protein